MPIYAEQVKIASIYALYTTICFRSVKKSLLVFPVRILAFYTTKSFDVFNHKGLTVNTSAGEKGCVCEEEWQAGAGFTSVIASIILRQSVES